MTTMRTSLLRSAVILAASVVLHPAFAQQTLQKLPVSRFSVGMYVVDAEVASTNAQRELGLMNRTHLDPNQGMMFIFDRSSGYCMWMKNTLIPLSVAFLDKDGVILNIEEMLPQTETNHCATKPALYALEMNAEWFKHKGIKPGIRIELVK